MTDWIDQELFAWDSHVASLVRFTLRPGVNQTAIYCRLLEGGGRGRERLSLLHKCSYSAY